MGGDCGNTFRYGGTPSASSSLGAFDAIAAARDAMPKRAGARLGELLVGEGLLTAADLKRALTDQRKTGRRLAEIIAERGFVCSPTLVKLLAQQHDLELATEGGYGAGLRRAIEERHRLMRGLQNGSATVTAEPHRTRAKLDSLAEGET